MKSIKNVAAQGAAAALTAGSDKLQTIGSERRLHPRAGREPRSVAVQQPLDGSVHLRGCQRPQQAGRDGHRDGYHPVVLIPSGDWFGKGRLRPPLFLCAVPERSGTRRRLKTDPRGITPASAFCLNASVISRARLGPSVNMLARIRTAKPSANAASVSTFGQPIAIAIQVQLCATTPAFGTCASSDAPTRPAWRGPPASITARPSITLHSSSSYPHRGRCRADRSASYNAKYAASSSTKATVIRGLQTGRPNAARPPRRHRRRVLQREGLQQQRRVRHCAHDPDPRAPARLGDLLEHVERPQPQAAAGLPARWNRDIIEGGET